MALRVCATAIVFAALVAAVFAVGTEVYVKQTTLPGGTFTVQVVDTVNPVASPTYHTRRNCMISPTTVSFPQVTADAASVSVFAGYTGTVSENGVTRTLCCAFFGRIDENPGSATFGDCTHDVCSFGNFDQLAYDGYMGDPLGSITTQSYGPTFFFASTSTTSSQLCFPTATCYETESEQSPPGTPVTTTEPYVHTIGAGPQSSSNDNFLTSGSVAATTQAVNSVRNAWINFVADYTAVNALSGPYVIPAGYYSAYEVATGATVFCTTSSHPCSGPSSRSQKFACKDRGAYDGTFCYLPCGMTFQFNFIYDHQNQHPDSVNPGLIPATSDCYANCVVHS